MRTTCGPALGLAFALSVGCAGPSGPAATGATASPTAAASVIASATPTGAATRGATTSPVLRFELTDVRTGERFTLGGFTGKTVIVQGMAVW
jgi:hypothetical protein